MQQNQSIGKSGGGGVRPILGASKPVKLPQNYTMDTQKSGIKSSQKQQQTKSLNAKAPKLQNRFNLIQNNKQQQQPIKQTSKAVMPQTPPSTVPLTKQQPSGLTARLAKQQQTSRNAPEMFITSFNINQHPEMEPIAVLIHYCRSKNYPLPSLTLQKGNSSSGTFSCSVNVNGTTFSTYPHEYENEFLAKEACAQKAVEYIKMQENKKPLPACSFTNTELLDKLYAEILNHSNGIFAKNLSEFFETTFQQQLPNNWLTLIQASSLFTTETTLSKVLIFANKDADSTPLPPEETTMTVPSDLIRLPWSDEYWKIFITHCASPVEVWGRLFGADYNVRFAALLNAIEVHMKTKKERAVSIARNNVYLVNINEYWHRVRVEEYHEDKGLAQCFFLDFGDADWLTKDQLYICEIQFLRLPAQAVPFSLYGLEDFEGYPYARKYLDDLLATKSLIGRVFTKENEFYDTNFQSHGTIQVVLFDTSTQEDVNLNHQLLNTICSAPLVPEVKQTLTEIIVTHIKDNGDIYVQVESPQLKYIQNQLHRITEMKFKRDHHKITFEDLKHSNLYLICDDDNDANDIKWYRASLAETFIQQPGNDNYLMYFSDHGITKSINISKIFSLHGLNVTLCKCPAQAIKVRLHNIPEITPDIVGQIRDMLPNDSEAFAELTVSEYVPLVRIFTH